MTGRIWDLDPAAYARHPLHVIERSWPEANCYVDLWVEMLHAAGAEPVAALPFTLAIDLEGDQWTFFKFPAADLEALYGVTVFELNVWRSLVGHLGEQIALGRPAIVEVDAFYLPDTTGISYRTQHVKTSIGVQLLDPDTRHLGYFHNSGYYELRDEDFTGLFRLDRRHLLDPEYLPPYVEVAKLPCSGRKTGRALVDTSLALLRAHLARRPRENPFRRYAACFPCDLNRLAGEPLSAFHNYAFATMRQCGSAFELAGTYLRWLEASGEPGLDRIAGRCDDIATTAKTMQYKTARAVATRRPFDAAPLLETMAIAWEETMAALSPYAS